MCRQCEAKTEINLDRSPWFPKEESNRAICARVRSMIKLSSFLHNPCRLTPAGVSFTPDRIPPEPDKIPLQGKCGRPGGLAYSLHILAYLMHNYAKSVMHKKWGNPKIGKICAENLAAASWSCARTRGQDPQPQPQPQPQPPPCTGNAPLRVEGKRQPNRKG